MSTRLEKDGEIKREREKEKYVRSFKRERGRYLNVSAYNFYYCTVNAIYVYYSYNSHVLL